VIASAPSRLERALPEDELLEHELAARVIDALLREDYASLSERVRLDHASRHVLSLPAGHGGAGPVVPLERDGFLADFRVRRTWRPTGPPFPAPAGPPLTLHDVESALVAIGDPEDHAGIAAFVAECHQALAALRLRERRLPEVRAALARRWRSGRNAGRGGRGQLTYEALAAAMPHPVYPTSQARLGLSDEDLLRYAPEFAPRFTLRWVAVPRSAVVTAGSHDQRPPGWPSLPEVGLPQSLCDTHDLMPVHPVTARHQLARALAEAGLSTPSEPAARAVVAPGAWLRVSPTLSMRTVAVSGQPRSHLKLPLPTSTLGLLNRRSIPPGTLADGALVRAILQAAIRDDTARDDALLGGLLLADEGTYAHARHPYLGYLLRRLPAGLDRCRVVPVAALLAPSPAAAARTGRPLVIEELASREWGGDLRGLLGAYLRSLFGVQVRLFARYGIALEAHQQNMALVLDGPAAPRLLVKDFDGTLVNLPRLASALGPGAPDESAFADLRLVTRSDDALADVFITITMHLCAGAVAFGLAERGIAPLPELLALTRRELTAAIDRHDGWPATTALRARVLDADRLPGKSMVTAGTLVAKSRTGASDVNKYYGTTGPNYLQSLP
jgi:siderophore synthetase component